MGKIGGKVRGKIGGKISTKVAAIDAPRVPGLRYVTDAVPGLRRRRAGKGFVYIDADGKRVRDRAEIDRIAGLAIPPAWTDVWICPYPNGHTLATGRDAKGRKQYRYHPRWRSVRDEAKFERTTAFGESLPALRRRVRKDMARTGMPKEKIVATIVALLDSCFARIGNEEYAKANGSFGLTTLRDRHARVRGSKVRLRFRGKGGKAHEVEIDDPRITYIVRTCQAIDGQELFQYLDPDGNGIPVGSSDVNEYLREVTEDDFSAKDFRTWAGTVRCAAELAGAEVARSQMRRNRVVLAAVDAVAEELGNTRSVCRNCYIHPDVIDGYADGSLRAAFQRRSSTGSSKLRALRADERFALQYLKSRARKASRAA
jgi:DNA topoisomerase-1